MPDDVSTSFKAASGPEIHQASPQKQTHLEVSDGGEGHEVLRGAQFSLLHTVHRLTQGMEILTSWTLYTLSSFSKLSSDFLALFTLKR